MSRPTFKYYLKAAASSYYTVTGAGVIVTSTPTPLAHAPMEWKDTDIKWTRNTKYHGVFRSFIVPMSFVKDAARILRKVYYTEGVEGVCILHIQRLNTTTQLYEDFYIGDIDFSQTKDTLHYFQATILDSGLAALIKAKESTPYEIPILNSYCLRILMDGIVMQGLAHYAVPQQGISSDIALSNTFLIATAGDEGLNGAGTAGTVSQLLPATLTLATSTIYHAVRNETLTIHFKGTLFASWPVAASSNVKFTLALRYGVLAGTVTDYLLYQGASYLVPGTSATYVIDVTYTFNVNAGDDVGLMAWMLDSGGTILSSSDSRFKVISDDAFIDITTTYTLDSSTIRSLRQYDVWSKHVELMGGGLYTFASNYLSNTGLLDVDYKPWNGTLTCGDAVRGLGDGVSPETSAKIVSVFNDLYKDSASRDMTGVGVEGSVVRVEKLDYFYDNSTVILDVGEVSNLQKEVASEYIKNLIKIGYNPLSNDDLGSSLNGKYEFNTSQTYAVGIKAKGEMDLISPFIASMYAEENIRANLSGKKTTDTKTDNSTFIIEIGDTTGSNGAYLLARRQNDIGNSATGLLSSATAFNLGVSPKHNFKRNEPLISTATHLQTGTITFQTTDKNPNVESQLSGAVGNVVENADVAVTSLANPLFLPIILSFDTKVAANLSALMAANPYGKITGTFRGVPFEGFIDEVSMHPADNAAQQWKLLAGPDLNLTTLIR